MEGVADNVRGSNAADGIPILSGDLLKGARRPDLLRRFTPTPHVSHVQLMKRTVRLETNIREVQDLALKFFRRYQGDIPGQPEFLWRVVCECDSQFQTAGLPLTAFSDSGLRYVNIGQRSFLAVDLEAREAISFLSHNFVEGEPRLRHRPPLDILFCLSAASLGLVALSAACVGWEDRAVLLFGAPNSGKTTASYLTAKLGLEFHADQVVFLDMRNGTLQAWGDPFPAVFRPEALKFLPELRKTARPSSYAEHSFLYFDKESFQARRAHPIRPVCSVFLDRGANLEAQATGIAPSDLLARLRDTLLFQEDIRFEAQIAAALSTVAQIPAYDFKYGSDPGVAATFVQNILTASQPMR